MMFICLNFYLLQNFAHTYKKKLSITTMIEFHPSILKNEN